MVKRVTNVVRYMLHKKDYQIFNYINDLIGCKPIEVAGLAVPLNDLSVSISEENLFSLLTEVPCFEKKHSTPNILTVTSLA